MIQSDENAEAMRKAGLTCEQLVAAAYVPAPAVNNEFWDRQKAIQDKYIDRLFENRMKK